ncbi:hypothetical protein ACQ5SP_10350 [Rhodovulum sp. YNF3179]|uniref:hypothetical protein n=1 Tax=Rhodovulum sp. YNF3179 TaxID=3425127 RepID=UPI003D326F4A
MDRKKGKRTERARRAWNGVMDWVRRRVPPGLRAVVGLLLMVGGVFGALPVLGFWMLPLGVAVIAIDVKSLAAWIRKNGRAKRKPRN